MLSIDCEEKTPSFNFRIKKDQRKITIPESLELVGDVVT
jgi:hypothetical protein